MNKNLDKNPKDVMLEFHKWMLETSQKINNLLNTKETKEKTK